MTRVLAIVVLALTSCTHEVYDFPLTCSLAPGKVVEPNVTSDDQTRLTIQAIMDYAVIASSLMGRIISTCAEFARESGVAQADINSAASTPDIDEQALALCTLAKGSPVRSSDGTCTLRPAIAENCGLACDAIARAEADCVGPSELAALRARLVLMAQSSEQLRMTVGQIQDISRACRDVPTQTVARATVHVTAALQALDDLQ